MKYKYILRCYNGKFGNFNKYVLEIGSESLNEDSIVDYECLVSDNIKTLIEVASMVFRIVLNKSMVNTHNYKLISTKKYKSLKELELDYIEELIWL